MEEFEGAETMTGKNRPGSWLILLGCMILIGAALLGILQIRDDRRAEEASARLVKQIRQQMAGIETAETGRSDAALPEDALGILEIPQLDLRLPVLGTYNEEKLQRYLCRYGQERCRTGQYIIAGHNYRSQLAHLGELTRGDTVTLITPETSTAYQVEDLEEIHGTDIDAMFAGDWDLTLFTCNFTGQKRITVRCSEIENEEKEQNKNHSTDRR